MPRASPTSMPTAGGATTAAPSPTPTWTAIWSRSGSPSGPTASGHRTRAPSRSWRSTPTPPPPTTPPPARSSAWPTPSSGPIRPGVRSSTTSTSPTPRRATGSAPGSWGRRRAPSSHATRPRRSSCGSWPRTRRPRPSTTPVAAPASSASPGARSRGTDCATRGPTPRACSPTRPRSGAIGSDTASRYPRQMVDRLVVRGAREHNLRDVSLDLPRDRLIVFTGLSGSGKSSLAFDTIYAEGQRRYVESLSAYARQFLGQMDKPDVDFIEGLSPAISIDQKSASRNPRSTVGTITEVYDYLRLLFARIGHPHCPTCGRAVARQTPQQIVDRVLELPEGTRFQVLAPVVRGRKGEYSTLLDDFAKQGFARVRVDGIPVELSERAEVNLARYEVHTIEVVVDRLIRRDGIRQRLTESIETALALTGGTAEVLVMSSSGQSTAAKSNKDAKKAEAAPDGADGADAEGIT